VPDFTGVITEPGLYPGIPEDAYHRDPVPGGSLSVSGAKLLLPPSCPAVYKYNRDHGHRASKAQDKGTVVHGLVLGTGAPVRVIDADSYRTKAAQQQRDEAIADGCVPVLIAEQTECEAIAAAVLNHDVAGALLDGIDAEVSMFWQDPEYGIWLRGRMDAMTSAWGFPCIVDFKTTADCSPEHFAKSAAEFGYHRQDPWYREGLAAALGCHPDEVDFVFVTVQTTAPHLVMVYRLHPDAVELGREQNRIARETYRDCTAASVWPTWSEDIEELPLPAWARRRMENEINEWHD
jgi:hypothetical protein